MNMHLIGVYECKLDAKSRLMLPKAFKKQLLSSLNSPFILKRSVFHKCLELFPMDEWNKVVLDINKLNRFVKKNNDFIRMFTAGVKVVDLDVTGRLLIPKDLQSYASIEKTVVLSSSANMIEIWDKNSYESIINNDAVDFASLAEDVMGSQEFNNE
ncbi:MAG: division/cell wall cluster transcriptional repressor MraZ [Flavobacteriales bacterium]|jgi:MraZ protein|nr:division/cell wall cluster transcriptional repressor MraZ [Flavobacteriales bacterium]